MPNLSQPHITTPEHVLQAQMTTVLIIAEDDALRAAWAAAAEAVGFKVRAVGSLLGGVDLLGTVEVESMLIDVRAEGDLELIAAISAYRPMPATVMVHDREITPPVRIRGVAVRGSDATPQRLVHLLKRMLFHRDLARPTNLPVRVTPVAAKWTSRLSPPKKPDDDDDDSGTMRLTFDGETSPDGWELAAADA